MTLGHVTIEKQADAIPVNVGAGDVRLIRIL
jgi:hypothetical protein